MHQDDGLLYETGLPQGIASSERATYSSSPVTSSEATGRATGQVYIF